MKLRKQGRIQEKFM